MFFFRFVEMFDFELNFFLFLHTIQNQIDLI